MALIHMNRSGISKNHIKVMSLGIVLLVTIGVVYYYLHRPKLIAHVNPNTNAVSYMVRFSFHQKIRTKLNGEGLHKQIKAMGFELIGEGVPELDDNDETVFWDLNKIVYQTDTLFCKEIKLTQGFSENWPLTIEIKGETNKIIPFMYSELMDIYDKMIEEKVIMRR